MDAEAVRARFRSVPVARLATVGASGLPHLVPITFALLGPDTLVTAVDDKPKRTRALQRLANLAAHPQVCVLADHYEEDWRCLWWARADGTARIEETAREPDALSALTARYPQYAERRPAGPLILIAVDRWSGWTAAGHAESAER